VASVVVVGGGIAGLSCAFRLRQAGHDVEVLERQSVVGGRMQSEVHGAFRIERGPECIAEGDGNLHELLTSLGLQASLQTVRRCGDAVLRAGRFASADWGALLSRSSVLSPLSRARLARVALDLARHRKVLNPLHPERATEIDREDAASYLARTAGSDARDFLVAPLLSATLHCDIAELSQAAALSLLHERASQGALQTLEGGLGQIPEALAERLRVRKGCEVVSLYTERDGARLEFRAGGRDRVVIADAAVVALPAPLVPALCPKLTPAERGYVESVRYSKGLLAHLMLAEEPRGLTHHRVAFPRSEGPDLYCVTAGHRRPGAAPRGAGLLRVAFSADASARLWDLPDPAIAERACEALAETPIGVLAPAASAVHRHPLMLPLFSPGSARRLASFLSRADRSPRLAFAGDYLVGPSAEAAVASGLRAAIDVSLALRHR